LKNVASAKISDYKILRDKTRTQAYENDSDPDGIGYDSCSSDDVATMMMRMEHFEN
jgi:hypothetical protein